MLFRLAFRNIKKNIRDYSVYFFTLVTAVVVFYSFNAIEGSDVLASLSDQNIWWLSILLNVISSESIVVAVFLGFMLVFSNRFFVKRRNKEFAVYMVLGMNRNEVMSVLFVESLLMGMFSLVVGIIIGLALSQLICIYVMSLFRMEMSSFRFIFSMTAVKRTALLYVLIYLVVFVLNLIFISRVKIIDLIHLGEKGNNKKVRRPAVYIIVLALSIGMTRLAFHLFDYNLLWLMGGLLLLAISVFFAMWSVLGIAASLSKITREKHHKGINAFLFHKNVQKKNTEIFMMVIVSLMLTATFAVFTFVFSYKQSIDSVREAYLADFALHYITDRYTDAEVLPLNPGGIDGLYEKCDYDLYSDFEETVSVKTYFDESFYFDGNNEVEDGLMKCSDYNKILRFCGRKTCELKSDEFLVVTFESVLEELYNDALERGEKAVVNGKTLSPAKFEVVNVDCLPDLLTFFVVPDEVVDEKKICEEHFWGNYSLTDDSDFESVEKRCTDKYYKVYDSISDETEFSSFLSLRTKQETVEDQTANGVVNMIRGTFVSVVILMICGVLPALYGISESVDNTQMYESLRKLGGDESDISRSVFIQNGLLFLIPFVFASVFYFYIVDFIYDVIGLGGTAGPVISSYLIVFIIYGGYFLLSYFGGKRIISGQS